MRVVAIFACVVIYLFLLVYIESELVKIEVRKENLKNRISELKNRKKDLQFEVMNVSNLALIEAQAKARGFRFPGESDVLGVLK
jgi:cell division protein FtsL